MKGHPEVCPTESVCVECGLCCSGMIFEDVELQDEKEATGMEVMGLEIEEEDGSFLLIQPCNALSGVRCNIYPYRPQCCRTFECYLLKNLQSGHITSKQALKIIHEIRFLLAENNQARAQRLIHKHLLKW